MIYKKEIKKLKEQRKKYFPVIAKLLDLYQNSSDDNFNYHFQEISEIGIIMELIDIGYIEAEAFDIKKSFNTIDSVSYMGEYPLTDTGSFVYNHNISQRRIKITLYAIAVFFGIITLIIIFMIL